MASKFQAFPGMNDLIPGEIEKWQWIEEKARIFFEAQGFKEIRTPLLEPTELFSRSIGQTTDIVSKEMYSFEDRGGRRVTLRPEMTASVARAVIEKGLLKQAKSLRFYYNGPMFRAERPQAGRKRQFHQVGIEIINEKGIKSDLEAVEGLYRFLKYVGLNKFILQINDLGEASDRTKSRALLVKYFIGQEKKLCKDCKWRLEKNVLRIFDCKISSCQPIIEKAPWDEISPVSDEFKKLCNELKEREIEFTINRRLVRGLDYYNGTVFEVAAEGLGAQNAIAGGGRYDGLYSQVGGSDTPSTGYSIGIERLLMALENEKKDFLGEIKEKSVYFAPLEKNRKLTGFCSENALSLREAGIFVEISRDLFSLSQHLKKANQKKIRFVIIVGPDEFKDGEITIKDLNEKKQEKIGDGELVNYFKKVFGL